MKIRIVAYRTMVYACHWRIVFAVYCDEYCTVHFISRRRFPVFFGASVDGSWAILTLHCSANISHMWSTAPLCIVRVNMCNTTKSVKSHVFLFWKTLKRKKTYNIIRPRPICLMTTVTTLNQSCCPSSYLWTTLIYYNMTCNLQLIVFTSTCQLAKYNTI